MPAAPDDTRTALAIHFHGEAGRARHLPMQDVRLPDDVAPYVRGQHRSGAELLRTMSIIAAILAAVWVVALLALSRVHLALTWPGIALTLLLLTLATLGFTAHRALTAPARARAAQAVDAWRQFPIPAITAQLHATWGADVAFTDAHAAAIAQSWIEQRDATLVCPAHEQSWLYAFALHVAADRVVVQHDPLRSELWSGRHGDVHAPRHATPTGPITRIAAV